MSVSREKVRIYIESKDTSVAMDTSYFLDIFDEYYKKDQEAKWFIKWDWAAFLLGPVWLAYRGMFWTAAVIFAITEALSYLDSSVYVVGIIILWVLTGLFGISIYFRHLLNWIKNNNDSKRGVDMTMATILGILFVAQIFTKLYTG